jgi:hypothetical protein
MALVWVSPEVGRARNKGPLKEWEGPRFGRPECGDVPSLGMSGVT